MENKAIASDVINYGKELAMFGPTNLTTGFLTNVCLNKIEKEEAMGLAMQSKDIIREMVKQLTASGTKPDDYDCRVLFQYVFDKIAEATYKTIVGNEVNIELYIPEAFKYHEPDLPDYIQQKITNVVSMNINVADKVLQHIDDNGYRTDDLENWFLPFLILSSGLAIQFTLEMDLDDDSELRHFIGED